MRGAAGGERRHEVAATGVKASGEWGTGKDAALKGRRYVTCGLFGRFDRRTANNTPRTASKARQKPGHGGGVAKAETRKQKSETRN